MGNLILLSGIIIAYLIGSIPTAYLCGRLLKGIDIRQFGSGNVGATNAFRVVGRIPGIFVLAIDILKGFVCVVYLADFVLLALPLPRPVLYKVSAGLAAIAGHNWPLFLKFRGGKGVATSAGVMIGLIPRLFLFGMSVWIIVFSISGYVSLSSIMASVCIPIFALLFGAPVEIVVFTSFLATIIVYKHRTNIRRLLNGEEKKISLFKRH